MKEYISRHKLKCNVPIERPVSWNILLVTVDIHSIGVCSRGAAKVENKRNNNSSRLSSETLLFPKPVNYPARLNSKCFSSYRETVLVKVNYLLSRCLLC